jgi:hypothetical protein
MYYRKFLELSSTLLLFIIAAFTTEAARNETNEELRKELNEEGRKDVRRLAMNFLTDRLA